jgi:hypothetical protein
VPLEERVAIVNEIIRPAEIGRGLQVTSRSVLLVETWKPQTFHTDGTCLTTLENLLRVKGKSVGYKAPTASPCSPLKFNRYFA